MTGASAWMPLYIGDYLGDTQRLTAEQHGIYLLLLMDYWRNGPPPADDAVLAQIGRVSLPAWRKSKATISRFFEERGGHLHHGRVDSELAKASENHGRRSAKAKKAADVRWHGQELASSSAPSIPQALLGECAPPSPSSVDKSTGGEPPGEDAVKALFDRGVAVLMAGGRTERDARSMVGKWRKAHGDARTQEVLDAALGKADPVAFAQATFAKPKSDLDMLMASVERKYPMAATG